MLRFFRRKKKEENEVLKGFEELLKTYEDFTWKQVEEIARLKEQFKELKENQPT